MTKSEAMHDQPSLNPYEPSREENLTTQHRTSIFGWPARRVALASVLVAMTPILPILLSNSLIIALSIDKDLLNQTTELVSIALSVTMGPAGAIMGLVALESNAQHRGGWPRLSTAFLGTLAVAFGIAQFYFWCVVKLFRWRQFRRCLI